MRDPLQAAFWALKRRSGHPTSTPRQSLHASQISGPWAAIVGWTVQGATCHHAKWGLRSRRGEDVELIAIGEERVSDAQTMPSSAHADRTTILVVDDEVIVRAFISDTLRDEGHTVLEAVNADEALAVLRSPLRIDLVLTDMRMPGTMDGAAFARLVRAELPFVKVAMIAGQSPDDELREVLDGFLPKPVTPTQLRSFLLTIFPTQSERDSP